MLWPVLSLIKLLSFSMLSMFFQNSGFNLGSEKNFITLREKMLHHIVLFKCAEYVQNEELATVIAEVKYQLELLPAFIPEILKFEVRPCLPFNRLAADLVLISEFADTEALQTYQQHPAHQAFIVWNSDKCPKISAADYII